MQSEFTSPKALLGDLLATIEKKQSEKTQEDRDRELTELKRRDEYAKAESENRRISWMNEFYQRTDRHWLPDSADFASLDSLDRLGPDKDATALLRAWRPADRFGFLIVGPAGSGKSFALQALAKSIIFDHRSFSERKQSLRWFPVTRGLDQIRREMSANGDELKQTALTCDYLFFDDLGAENLTDWAREQIYQIMEHRLSFGLATFISSNCSLDELKTRYHERFVSRLKEMMIVLQLQGRDRRGDTMKSNIQILKERIKRGEA